MRRTTRRMASSFTALAVAASLALTGCGRDSSSDAGPGASKAIGDSKASGTINVWAMGTEGEKLQDFVKDFEAANPDATVKVTAVPWEAAHDKISAAIASGKTPDASLIGTTWMGEFAKAGGLDPTPDGLVKDSDFYDGAWGSTVVGNTSYGVPWYVETRVLYYRDDLGRVLQVRGGPEEVRRAVPRQPPARPDRLLADRAALRLVQRRQGHQRRRHRLLHRQPADDRGAELLQVVLRQGLLADSDARPGRARERLRQGHLRVLHLRAVAHRPGRGRRADAGQVRRGPAARQGLRPRHLVHRRRRPGRLQGRQEP